MAGIREFLGLTAPLAGLEDILKHVADGKLAQDVAARQIRQLALKPHIPPWLPRIFRIIGLVFTLVGIGLGVYSVVFSIGAKEVQGTVIVGGQSPIAEYIVDEKRFTVQSGVSSKPPAHVVGEKVSVLYRPDNPAKAQINSFINRWFFPVIFTFSGISTVIISFFLPRIIKVITGTA